MAIKREKMKKNTGMESLYDVRLEKKIEELRWLYMELYGNDFDVLRSYVTRLNRFYAERAAALKELDQKAEKDPRWYKKNDMLGMMFYIDNFAGNMKGVESKLDYLEKNNVNYIHLMPFLET